MEEVRNITSEVVGKDVATVVHGYRSDEDLKLKIDDLEEKMAEMLDQSNSKKNDVTEIQLYIGKLVGCTMFEYKDNNDVIDRIPIYNLLRDELSYPPTRLSYVGPKNHEKEVKLWLKRGQQIWAQHRFLLSQMINTQQEITRLKMNLICLRNNVE